LFIYIKHAGYAAPIRKQSLQLLFFMFFFPRKAGFRAEVSGTQLDKETKKFHIGRQRRSKKIRMLHLGKASLQRGLSFLFVTEIFLIVMSLG
jgi:hypothetical protein